MEQRVLSFINGLRGRGISVSPAESIDALNALAVVGLEEPWAFRSALRASLVKRSKELPVFEELFPLYFCGLDGGEDKPLIGQDLLDRLEEQMAGMAEERAGELDPLLLMLLSGRGGETGTFIRQAANGVGTSQLITKLQVGMYSRRIYEALDWERMESQLEDMLARLEEQGWSQEELEAVEEAFRASREILKQQVKSYVEREQTRNAAKEPGAERLERLMNRPLSTMDELELQQLRKVVDVLARKLRNRISLREKRIKKGKLDVRATLRKNMQHGGVPFELVLRRKRIEKAELMVLCDVSSSVARVSQFMLQFVYTIQDCLAKVRSFVFVDDLGEVTEFFREEEIEEGVRMALSEADIPYHVRSDFGEVFNFFCRRYLQDVGYRTHILIIGDARNNYNDSGIASLERISERAKGLIWLNPETEPFWDTGDSVIGEYKPYCREVRVCRTLRDLEDTVSSLLL
ncbi:MAG: VWA domain-containing protein [Actinomycetota bacterium]|nr:VWA domain-containing protein [Actinomycetota bacterium]